MTDDQQETLDVTPPTAAALEALPSDDWAALLRSVRVGLQQLEEHEASPAVRRLRAAPTGRLAGGRVRRELCALLAGGGAPWRSVVEHLRTVPGLPDTLAAISRGEPVAGPASAAVTRSEAASASVGDRAGDELERARRDLARAQADAERARARLRDLRAERAIDRRRAEGAERRAVTAETEVATLRAEVAALRAERARLAAASEEAQGERRRAVEREARRQAAELERLRSELAALRRAEEDRRLATRRRDAAARQERRETAQAQAEARREADAHRGTRVRPGRPSVLPDGVVPETAEAADALLHAGRLVLVDGYNLTLQHRGGLPLETQRTWLTQLLANLAAQRRVRPVVVFDGERAGGGRPLAGGRGVEVRFTPAGITADDELVLAVEATDEPVLVVTDDRELRARVQGSGADVVGTGPFLWAVG